MDLSHIHLEVACDEAVERHRPVVRNAVLVQLAFDQARQVRVKGHFGTRQSAYSPHWESQRTRRSPWNAVLIGQ